MPKTKEIESSTKLKFKNPKGIAEKAFYDLLVKIFDTLPEINSFSFWIDGVNHDFVINCEDYFFDDQRWDELENNFSMYDLYDKFNKLKAIYSELKVYVPCQNLESAINEIEVYIDKKRSESIIYKLNNEIFNCIEDKINNMSVSSRKSLYKKLVHSDYGVFKCVLISINRNFESTIKQIMD